MLNNNQGGLDPSNARPYASQFGSGTGQSQGSFSLGANLPGLHNLPGSYNMQSSLSQNRLGGLPTGGQQIPQGVFRASGNAAGGLGPQGYTQIAIRSGAAGLPVMNGLGSGTGVGAMSRGSVAGANAGLASARGQGGGLGGLGLQANQQRQQGQGLSALSGPRGIMGLGIGGLGGGHLGAQPLNSPGRSTAMNLGYASMGQTGLAGSHHPSGDLLAMIGKAGVGNQLSNLGNLGTSFATQQAGGGNAGQAGVSQPLGQEQEQASFDPSDFPALGGPPRGQAGLANGDGAGLGAPDLYSNLGMHKGVLPSEFNMQSEEFPALPGAAAARGHPASEERGQAQLQQQQGQHLGQASQAQGAHSHLRPAQSALSTDEDVNRVGAMYGNLQEGAQVQQPGAPSTQEHLLRYYQLQHFRSKGALGGQAGGPPQIGAQQVQGPKVGSMAAPADRFGLLGLLGVIRMTDPDLTTLALGTDLTTLGLHLNSPENVYKTFASPWADQPLRPEPDFRVPGCYRQPAPRLQPGYFSKFQQDTLFYIFYSMPADEAQVFAADELASRGWWFHKEFKLWLSRVQGVEPIQKTGQMERGSFCVFDTATWEVVRKDNFVLHYDALERPPGLPRQGPQPANTATVPAAK